MIDKPLTVLMPEKIGLMSVASIVTEQGTMREIVVRGAETRTGTPDPDLVLDLDLDRLVVGIETTVDRSLGIVVIARTEDRRPDTAGTVEIVVIGSTAADHVLQFTSAIETSGPIRPVVSRVDY
jgi:hypothetical protein